MGLNLIQIGDFILDDLYFYIGIGVLAFIIFLIILFVILNKFVFSRRRIRRNFNELNKRYKYLQTLLYTQDAQYIQKLDLISRTNLLYADVYQTHLERFKEIRDELDNQVEDAMNVLSVLLEDKNVKAYKIQLAKYAPLFREFEDAIKKLDEDLTLVIRPEEDCRKESLMLKDKYREVKTLYEEKKDSLEFVNDRFEIIFKNIDKKFNVFEEEVETAQYDEARELLPTLAKVLSEVKKILEILPTYLEEVNEKIPQEMGRTLDKYNKLVLLELPLKHLNVEEEMDKIKEVLVEIREGFKQLKIDKVGDKIDGLHIMLNQLNENMDKEEDARNKFNDVYQDVMKEYTELEKNVIKLNNSVPHFEKYYIIDEANQLKLKNLSVELDTLSKIKRRVDFYVHGVEKTFYTDLLNKINDLRNGVGECNKDYEEYKVYLDSLKKDSDSAYKTIKARYLQLKRCEKTLRDFKNDNLASQYAEDIDRCYNLMDEISRILKAIPIDVITLNYLNNQLNEISSHCLEEVDNLNNYRSLSIDNITLINRDRMKFSDIHNLLLQAEQLFFDGQFKSSYDMTETIINRIEDKDKAIK